MSKARVPLLPDAADLPVKKKIGRPEGALSKIAREAREKAMETGMLPHEILLDMARGNPQVEYVPEPNTGKIVERIVVLDVDQRRDAAKAAAPYYAPKISAVEVISGVAENELDRIIAQLAAEAGISAGISRESQEGEGEEDS